MFDSKHGNEVYATVFDSDEFEKIMTYYKCAMMEIETKFNVLNEE